MLKYTKYLFWAFTALGAVVLAIFSVVFYWEQTWSIELLAVQRFLGDSYLEWSGLNSFFFFTAIAGTAFLVAGIPGLIIQSIKKHRVVFAILTAVLIPLLFLGALILSSSILSSHQSEKMSITDFRVESTNPLTISLEAKSSYYYEIDFETAFIKANNQTIVAQVNSNWVESNRTDYTGHPVWTMNFLYKLPPGHKQALVFTFNNTLPTGNYTFWLSTHRQGSFVSFNFEV